MAGSKNRVLTDRDEIREWAESRGASPACVRGTGGAEDVGMIRLDFPGYSGETSLQHIDWDEWLEKFDENGLALIVEDTTAGGQKSNFNKLVSRTTAAKKSATSRKAAKKTTARKAAGGAKHTARKSTSKKTAVSKGSGSRKTAEKKSAKRARGRAR